MRKFTPLFAELQIMELFEFRSCLNLNGFLQSVDSCTTMTWLAREYNRGVRPVITRCFLWADTSVCPYGKYNVIRTFVGAHRCVRPAIAQCFLWADTSVCPYGKYNVIRTFVGVHRCVRPAITRRFLWADTSVCPYGTCNVIRTFVGAHRCVRPAITRRFLWADTSVCPHGKYNFIRTFVGAHRCVRPAIARRFLWADTSVCTTTTYKKACPCKKSRPRNIKVLNYFLFSNENLLAIDNVDTGNGNRVNLAAGEVINSTLAEVIAGNTLDILNTGCTAPVEAIELNSFVGY